MSDIPSSRAIISLVQEHFGLTLAETIEAIKTPTHPRGLRDEFAARAMQAYLSDLTARWGPDDLAHAAAKAYEVADAMLKARTE